VGRSIQIYDYYPFGLTFNSWQRLGGVKNDYLYNGKEMQDELDLGWGGTGISIGLGLAPVRYSNPAGLISSVITGIGALSLNKAKQSMKSDSCNNCKKSY